MDDIVLRLAGMREKRNGELRELYQQVQMQSYYTILPHLPKSAKNKPIDEIVPNIYDKPKPKKDLKAWQKSVLERLERAGLLNDPKAKIKSGE